MTVDAANIDQEGALLAPLGTIRLGAKAASDLSPNDPNQNQFVATQNVILGANSVTSVSLNGAIVPFGETENGTNWSYDSTVGVPLGNPPTKNIIVSGAAIDQQSGATLDISGGGDIQASEFVRGTGGSRDVLADNPNTYAIIPGYNPGASPLDFDFISSQGDQVPLAGTSVFLSGGNGLPAGFYTLLPAHYATLPGAYRVTVVANSARISGRARTFRLPGRNIANGRVLRQSHRRERKARGLSPSTCNPPQCGGNTAKSTRLPAMPSSASRHRVQAARRRGCRKTPAMSSSMRSTR